MKIILIIMAILFSACRTKESIKFPKEIILKNDLSTNLIQFKIKVQNPSSDDVIIEKISSGCKIIAVEEGSAFTIKALDSVLLNFAYEKDEDKDTLENKTILFRTNTDTIFHTIKIKAKNRI